MGLDGIVHLMPLSPDLLDAPQRAAWQASSRGATWSFFEWWEHFDPDGPGGDALVAAFERHRPVFDATLVAFHAAFVQDDPDNPYRTDARELAPARLLASQAHPDRSSALKAEYRVKQLTAAEKRIFVAQLSAGASE